MNIEVSEASKNSPFDTQQWVDYLLELGKDRSLSIEETEGWLAKLPDEAWEVIMANFLINFKQENNG